MSTKGLIPRSEQGKHREDVTRRVLEFLFDETYTTSDVIKKLLGYSSLQGATGLMKKLEREGLIKHHAMKNLAGRGLHLWGISKRGIYAICDPDELPERVRSFEPSRVSLLMLPHKIEIQLVKIFLLENKWSIQSIDPDVWEKKIPDIVCKKPNEDRVISLEVELNIKSQKRYISIIKEYQELQDIGRVDRVVWLTETDRQSAQLAGIFKRINEQSSQLHVFMTLAKFKGMRE